MGSQRRIILGIGHIDVQLLVSAALAGPAPLWTRDKRLAAVAEGLKLAYAEQ